jgi:secreted PhoX family phosphatase
VGGGPITSLSQSPFAAGQVYGLKLSRGSNNGQGNNTGLGVWVAVPNSDNANLRAAAPALGLTGYYRPEDLELDTKALALGNVRACGNNTGNEGDKNFGETLCITDGPVAQATTNTANPEVQYFVISTPELAMQDNIAQYPKKNFWAILEDGAGASVGKNNDIWACLDDGADFDLLSDGCVRFASLNDLNAEWTGGIFDATGHHFYVSVQHNVTGHGVILDITGWGGH